MSLTSSTPMTAAEVRNFGCSFITKRSSRFLEQFWTASSMSTDRPVLEMPDEVVVSSSLFSSVLACGLGGRAVMSTAEMDSLVCSEFFTSRARISEPVRGEDGELGMTFVLGFARRRKEGRREVPSLTIPLCIFFMKLFKHDKVTASKGSSQP